jgi:ABC-type phosphate transport system permease subunit
LAVLLILLGIAGAVIAAMMISDYFVLRDSVVPEQHKGFAGMLFKTLTLGGLHLVLLVPIGVLGVRRPRG